MIDIGRWMYVSLIVSIVFIPIFFLYGRCALGGPFGVYGDLNLMLPVTPMFLVTMHVRLWHEFRGSKSFRLESKLAWSMFLYYVCHLLLQVFVYDTDGITTHEYSVASATWGISERISKFVWGCQCMLIFGFGMVGILFLRRKPPKDMAPTNNCGDLNSIGNLNVWMYSSLYQAIWSIPMWFNFGRFMMGGVFGTIGVHLVSISPIFIFFHLHLWRVWAQGKHSVDLPSEVAISLAVYFLLHYVLQVFLVETMYREFSVASFYFDFDERISQLLAIFFGSALVMNMIHLLWLSFQCRKEPIEVESKHEINSKCEEEGTISICAAKTKSLQI